MADWYQQLTANPVGRQVTEMLGVPASVELRRHSPGAPVVDGPVLLGDAPGGWASAAVRLVLNGVGADVRDDTSGDHDERLGALVFDATGIGASEQLVALYDFFSAPIRRMAPSGRLLVLGDALGSTDARRAAAQRALDGFIRSVGKEMRAGGTANLIRVADGAQDGLASTLRFFLSGRSAFVSGQTVHLGAAGPAPAEPADWDRALDGKVAVVTGAAQGIGAAIAQVLARAGAQVVALDIPAQGDALTAVANDIKGSALQLDITADDAPAHLGEHLRARNGGVDIVVHNAGITRDKTLAGMDADRWNSVMSVNLSSQERINAMLLADGVLREGGRVVCISSLSGLAGNRGQTNYAASKAGVLGMVEALAPAFAQRSATINAIAPGFIETAMTSAMPFVIREAGRRMNSVNQGGRPEDVAETVAWLAEPGSAYINGTTVRVCGQSLLGA